MSEAPPLIEASGLALGYNATPVAHGLEFVVSAGDRVGVLGANGGGKTTLLRGLLGEVPVLAGSLTVRARCATVPQTDRSRLDYPISALDVAQMGSLARLPWWRRPGRAERQSARAALERVGIGDLADRTFGDLSGGQRQRVLIARGLVQGAEILLLDEPFTGLDGKAAAALEALIDELAGDGKAILIATHDLEQACRWDRVLCLNRAQIVFGEPEVALSREVLERTYGDEIVELPEGETALLPPHHHHHA